MDKKIITSNFSRCAYLYDRYADIQKISALRMLDEIEGDAFGRVLEIGCGTGNYTLLLRGKFRQARITALDISPKMLEVARLKLKDKGIEFALGDGEFTDFPREKFDLITSNACFQWFEDLEAALIRYKRLVKKGGLISFSVFGPLTFRELSVTLESVMGKKPIAAGNFMDRDKINKVLKRAFNKSRVREFTYSESFESLAGLLNKIRYTGVRGNGAGSKFFLGHKNLDKLEGEYLNKFQQVKATYQVFFCQGLA